MIDDADSQPIDETVNISSSTDLEQEQQEQQEQQTIVSTIKLTFFHNQTYKR